MNIYVGNLSPETTEDQLRQAFEAFGQVGTVNIVRDRATGQSRGFGFVGMPSETEARAAITKMNGADLNGQTINAEEGRTKPSPPGLSGRGGPRGHGRPGGPRRPGGFGGGGSRGGSGGGHSSRRPY